MASLNISLPDSLREFVEGQVAAGGYSTASEYMRALIREAQRRHAGEKVEHLLLDGIESGAPIAVTPDFWERKRSLAEKSNPSVAES